MAVDLSYVGKSGEWTERRWTTTDTLLYAVAVGAGHADPGRELEFTTENSSVDHLVLPSFICVAAGAPLPEGFSVDMTRMLHADMSFELFDALPAEGHVSSQVRIEGIYDKGSGALVSTVTDVVNAATKKPLARLTSGMFIRGNGGFGGERGPIDDWELPDRDPDAALNFDVLPEQALIYRLTGDRNPLHSDPVFAAKAGFPAPILHGMATYGFTARALLHAAAGSDPSRFGSMYGRFTKPVELGEPLTVQIWRTPDGALFRTLDSLGDVVIDRGRMTTRNAR